LRIVAFEGPRVRRRPRVAFVSGDDSRFIELDSPGLAASFLLQVVGWCGKRSIPALVAAVARSDAVWATFLSIVSALVSAREASRTT